MQMMNQMERQAHAKDAETLNLWSKLQAVEQKEESKAYAQRRETKATPETHYPIARMWSRVRNLIIRGSILRSYLEIFVKLIRGLMLS